MVPMEEELLARSRRHDADAFARLVELHTPALYGFLRVRAPQELVADLAQEAFLRAWRAIPDFQATCSFRFWLYRIALNVTNTELRRRQRLSPWHDQMAETTLEYPSERLEIQAEHQDLRTALEALAPPDQELLQFLYRDRLSYEEIGQLIGLPVATIKVRLHRARQRLKVRLESSWEVQSS